MNRGARDRNKAPLVFTVRVLQYLAVGDLNPARENLSSWQTKTDCAQPVQAGQTGLRAKLLWRHRPAVKTTSRLLLLLWLRLYYCSVSVLTLSLSHTSLLPVSVFVCHVDRPWGTTTTMRLSHYLFLSNYRLFCPVVKHFLHILALLIDLGLFCVFLVVT